MCNNLQWYTIFLFPIGSYKLLLYFLICNLPSLGLVLKFKIDMSSTINYDSVIKDFNPGVTILEEN